MLNLVGFGRPKKCRSYLEIPLFLSDLCDWRKILQSVRDQFIKEMIVRFAQDTVLYGVLYSCTKSKCISKPTIKEQTDIVELCTIHLHLGIFFHTAENGRRENPSILLRGS